VPGEFVVEMDEFETSDSALVGAMTAGVSPADNETGGREALDRLAAVVEAPG